jgi:DNA-binding beta-propeller fold protein YncE/20S proteasome alpha/beta subunit
MTYILACVCKDGVALIADRKIVYGDYKIQYRDKLIIIDDTMVIGASGDVSLFDTFRERIRATVEEYRQNKDINLFMSKIREITKKVNSEYEYLLHSRDFDLLIAVQSSHEILLRYLDPSGNFENISTFRVIGLGEPYGLIFLRKLWHPNITMVEAAELGNRIITYIEKFELNGSVGLGNNGRPQILFMSNDGRLRKASDSLLNRLHESSNEWLQRFEDHLKQIYKPSLTADGYVCINSWKMQCIGDSGLVYTEGIDLNSHGHVYVAAQSSRCVEKFNNRGEFISMLRSAGTQETKFNAPYAITIDSLDNVYVSVSDSCRIQKFDNKGEFSLMWGSRGEDEGQFSSPHGLCVDTSGNVYVTEETNHRIQKFDSHGEFIMKWGNEGKKEREFSHPIGIATDANDNVYVADYLNHRIQKFDDHGEFIMKWGEYGIGDGQFDCPHGVTFDSSNKLYVTDSLNHRIQVFNSEGSFIMKWGVEGYENGQLKVPRDLVVDVAENVYVSDGGNHRIQVFAPTWKHVSDLDFFNEPR